MFLPPEQEAWSPPVALTVACLLSAAIYLRGFLLLRRSRPSVSPWRAVSFCGGLAVLWIALGSPLEELADRNLTAHMIEHLLLMSVVPPLLLVGWPAVPLLRGFPVWLRKPLIHPLLGSRHLRSMGQWLVKPIVAWTLMNLTLLAWHVPVAFDFALNHEGWHVFEHVCFLSTSLLFWWVLLRPWPALPQGMGWGAPVYLVAADLVNTALSATLAFIGHPVYTYYLRHAETNPLDPLTDQTVGATIMWVFGSLVFLIPTLILSGRLLQGGTTPNRIASS